MPNPPTPRAGEATVIVDADVVRLNADLAARDRTIEELRAQLVNQSRTITPYGLAVLMHDTYELEAYKAGWETHDSCRVPFDQLPDANKAAMLKVAEAVLWATPDLTKLYEQMEKREAELRASLTAAGEVERRLREALEQIWAAIGDRLLADGPLSSEYARAVRDEIKAALTPSDAAKDVEELVGAAEFILIHENKYTAEMPDDVSVVEFDRLRAALAKIGGAK